mgnify:CR=1 FL=1
MFTGIIEVLGTVASIESAGELARLAIDAPEIARDVRVGESVAVNGCCLTVTTFGDDWFTADVSDETVSRTRLADVEIGEPVNLERAVRVEERIGRSMPGDETSSV